MINCLKPIATNYSIMQANVLLCTSRSFRYQIDIHRAARRYPIKLQSRLDIDYFKHVSFI